MMQIEERKQDQRDEEQEQSELDGHDPIESTVVRDPDPDPKPPPPTHR